MADKSLKKIEFVEWLHVNSAYEYYATQLEKQMEGFDTIYMNNRAYVSCFGYEIMVFEVRLKSIFLINDEKDKEKSSFVQKKLEHEYCEMFNLYKSE